MSEEKLEHHLVSLWYITSIYMNDLMGELKSSHFFSADYLKLLGEPRMSIVQRNLDRVQ